MNKNLSQLVLVNLLIWVLISCNMQGTNSSSNSNSAESCITPSFTLSFPETIESTYPLPQGISPLNPWEKVASLTDVSSNIQYRLSFAYNKDRQEIWGHKVVLDNLDITKQKPSLLIYNVVTDEWTEIANAFETIPQTIIGVYISSDKDKIWAVSQTPLTFSEYNSEKKVFERLPLDLSESGFVVFDNQQNLFWLFDNTGNIYSINLLADSPINFHVTTSTHPISPTSISIANDVIYFVGASKSSPTNNLYKFDPNTNTIEEIQDRTLKNFGVFFSIFGDSHGNLWVENKGWKTIDNTWNTILSSPAFVGEATNGGEVSNKKFLALHSANIIFESSDGRLWFRSTDGMVWLDYSEARFCKFTTYGLYDNITMVEDSDYNLWMIADNKLYKLPLGEQ